MSIKEKILNLSENKVTTKQEYYGLYDGDCGQWVSPNLLDYGGELDYSNLMFTNFSKLIVCSATDVLLFNNKIDAVNAKKHIESKSTDVIQLSIFKINLNVLEFYSLEEEL